MCLYTNTPVLPNSAILGQFFVCYDIANLVCMAWYQRPFDFYVFYGYSSVCLSVRPPIHLADIYDVYEYTCFSSYLSVRPSARLTISSSVCLVYYMSTSLQCFFFFSICLFVSLQFICCTRLAKLSQTNSVTVGKEVGHLGEDAVVWRVVIEKKCFGQPFNGHFRAKPLQQFALTECLLVCGTKSDRGPGA